MADVEAMERALAYPWEKWTVFLHPAQRQLVEREYRGPARVAGSAGTGKTIVALHRAVHLARAHPESRVLLATFSDALAAALRARLRRLIGNEPQIAERLEVHSMSGIGRRLYAASVGRLDLAADEDVRELLRQAPAGVEGHRFGAHFLWTEWSTVVDAWQLAKLGGLPRRAAARPQDPLGREAAGAALVDLLAGPVCARRTGEIDGARHVRAAGGEDGRGCASIVRFLCDRRGPGRRRRGAAVSGGPGRRPAEQLVLRRGSRAADLPDAVLLAGARRRRTRGQREGYAPQAIGVFVRSLEQIERALSAVQAAGMRSVQLDDGSGGVSGSVAVGTMHRAKGLEFRAVAVAACDDEVIPLQTRIERVGDDADLEEVYGTERHLLYVACTRARDRLLVTGVDPGSEFLDDLRAGK